MEIPFLELSKAICNNLCKEYQIKESQYSHIENIQDYKTYFSTEELIGNVELVEMF